LCRSSERKLYTLGIRENPMVNSWGFFIFYPIPLIVVGVVKCFPGSDRVIER
jgi:hypothetical protein